MDPDPWNRIGNTVPSFFTEGTGPSRPGRRLQKNIRVTLQSCWPWDNSSKGWRVKHLLHAYRISDLFILNYVHPTQEKHLSPLDTKDERWELTLETRCVTSDDVRASNSCTESSGPTLFRKRFFEGTGQFGPIGRQLRSRPPMSDGENRMRKWWLWCRNGRIWPWLLPEIIESRFLQRHLAEENSFIQRWNVL